MTIGSTIDIGNYPELSARGSAVSPDAYVLGANKVIAVGGTDGDAVGAFSFILVVS